METITAPHLPQYPLLVALFTQVENASFLRQQLLQGNTDFEYAFLDASTVLSRNHLLAACFRAINDSLNGRLKTRNVHSEIVFSLSTNNNIAESFRRFGITNDSKTIIAVKVGHDSSLAKPHLAENVKGDVLAFSDETLAQVHDLGRIRKLYRLDAPKKATDVLVVREVEPFIIGSMALKGS